MTTSVLETIQKILGPQASDKEYTAKLPLRIAILLRLDSYKFSHPYAYPENIIGMSSYGEARVERSTKIVAFNMQYLLSRYFQDPITMADIDIAEAFALKHFGRKLFRRATWERIVKEFGGLLPITIRAVPEGTVLGGGLPIYSVTAFGRDFFWLSSGVETILQRGIWYGSTVASMDYAIKKDIKQRYEQAGAESPVEFALHDFGGRGVTCAEQAEIGGAAHLVNFMGSDTVEGILSMNHYYDCEMAAFSVYATEHSVECSFGRSPEQELEYLRHQLHQAPPGSIISIVIDGYDVYRAAEQLCTSPLKEEIIASGVKVVFRPDSGDMMETVPRILKLQEAAYGHTITKNGYKKINYVGIIQGDGVDHLAIRSLLGKLMANGYSPDNVIFGSGGALLQKVNRDTFKFAQKASAVLFEGDDKWTGIAKDPITDPGKKSKEGVLTLVRSKMTGELMAARLDQGPLDESWEDLHKLVYHNGQLYNETTLAEIRARAAA